MRKAQITVAILALLILGGFTWLAIHSGVATQNLEHKTIKLQSAESKLKDVNLQVEQLKTQSQRDKEKQAEQQKLLEQKEAEKQDLQKQVQAKADAKAKLELAAANLEKTVTGRATASAMAPVSGSKSEWMAQAGIGASDYGYVDYIVNRESGWNPNAVNASSGACGLGQQLPCGKWAGAWNDPVAALRAMQGYAVQRYGSWAGAHSFWLSHNWW